MPGILEDHVLILDKGWSPIGTSTVRDVFGRLFSGSVKALNTDDYSLHSIESWLELPVTNENYAIRTSRLSIRVPEVVILIETTHIPIRRSLRLGRRNLMRRDRGTCQYCGRRPGPKSLTIDHVYPRSKGGKTTWTNCVMACFKCNSKKGNETLDTASMQLRIRPEMKLIKPQDPILWNRPYQPEWSPVFDVLPGKLKDSWRNFLPEKQWM